MPSSKLDHAINSFYSSLEAIFQGNTAPMFDVWSHADDVTYMGPLGELLVGWTKVKESWLVQAKLISDGKVQPTDLHYFEDKGLAVVSGYEVASVTIEGKQVQLTLRATSVFRMESGEFKMVAHHTDQLPPDTSSRTQ